MSPASRSLGLARLCPRLSLSKDCLGRHMQPGPATPAAVSPEGSGALPRDWQESLGGGSSGIEGWLLQHWRWPGAGPCGLFHVAGGELRQRDHGFAWAVAGGPLVSRGGGPTALRPGDDLPRGLVPVCRQTFLCSPIAGRCFWGASRPPSPASHGSH